MKQKTITCTVCLAEILERNQSAHRHWHREQDFDTDIAQLVLQNEDLLWDFRFLSRLEIDTRKQLEAVTRQRDELMRQIRREQRDKGVV